VKRDAFEQYRTARMREIAIQAFDQEFMTQDQMERWFRHQAGGDEGIAIGAALLMGEAIMSGKFEEVLNMSFQEA
jgi:hypothetical protein